MEKKNGVKVITHIVGRHIIHLIQKETPNQ